MNTRSLISTIVLLVSTCLTSRAANSADVIAYGSTPGGFRATAREGATVILLEPTARRRTSSSPPIPIEFQQK